MAEAPLILACDTTQGACSACVYQNGVLAAQTLPMQKGHAEALLPMIDAVLRAAKCTPQQIDRLAVTNGPGTFTGVRVGLAAMRGLALALAVPLKAYGTLHVMARAAETQDRMIVAVDARRDSFYAQAFNGVKTALGAPQALCADAVLALADDFENSAESDKIALIGSGAELLMPGATSRFYALNAPFYPQAETLAAMAAYDDDWSSLSVPEPVYLRPPDATLPNRDKFPARQS
jgi:tRNA threonylcarbamoyl adenosine modification protein YeaZ